MFQKTDETLNNASDAVESLLMLGRDIWSKSNHSSVTDLSVSKGRRFSSGEVSLSHDEKGVVTYYQVIYLVFYAFFSSYYALYDLFLLELVITMWLSFILASMLCTISFD